MLNCINLTGRLTKAPEIKYTQNGVPVTSFTLAVNRTFTNDKGEKEADFIQCVAWKKTAEIMGNTLLKGSLIALTGRLQTRSYEDQSGKRVFVSEVNVDSFYFLDSRQNFTENKGQTTQPQTQQYNRYGG